MKIVKHLLILTASVGLMAGCATNRNNAGGTGNESQTGSGSGSSIPEYKTPPFEPQHPMYQNSSIGPGNPFGLGTGNTDNF
jgi:hypothetical protein